MKYNLSVCAIFKDEAPYLAEWIDFHRLMGVEHFFLYNNNSSDDFASVLKPYQSLRLITLTNWPRSPGQMPAYNHCLYVFGSHSRWIAFIDIDEFLFSPTARTLGDVLQGYDVFAGVAVNWVNYGSAGHIRTPTGGVLKNYRYRGELDVEVPYDHLLLSESTEEKARYLPLNRHIKSIVKPEKVVYCSNPHYFVFDPGSICVTESGEPVSGPFAPSVSVDRFRINHYWSKSVQEYDEKMIKGRADTGGVRSSSEFTMRDRRMNAVLDDTIIRCVAQIKGEFSCDVAGSERVCGQ